MMALVEIFGTTILVIMAGGIGWLIKAKHESLKIEREAIRQQRFDSYMDALDPLLKILISVNTNTSNSQKQKGKKEPSLVQKMNMPEYRRNAFHLLLFGDDNVVEAWNALWHELYKDPITVDNIIVHLDRIGELLVQIRKSLGHPDTNVEKRDMFKWFIKDFELMDMLAEKAKQAGKS
jgi:hypothetical protein